MILKKNNINSYYYYYYYYYSLAENKILLNFYVILVDIISKSYEVICYFVHFVLAEVY